MLTRAIISIVLFVLSGPSWSAQQLPLPSWMNGPFSLDMEVKYVEPPNKDLAMDYGVASQTGGPAASAKRALADKIANSGFNQRFHLRITSNSRMLALCRSAIESDISQYFYDISKASGYLGQSSMDGPTTRILATDGYYSADGVVPDQTIIRPSLGKTCLTDDSLSRTFFHLDEILFLLSAEEFFAAHADSGSGIVPFAHIGGWNAKYSVTKDGNGRLVRAEGTVDFRGHSVPFRRLEITHPSTGNLEQKILLLLSWDPFLPGPPARLQITIGEITTDSAAHLKPRDLLGIPRGERVRDERVSPPVDYIMDERGILGASDLAEMSDRQRIAEKNNQRVSDSLASGQLVVPQPSASRNHSIAQQSIIQWVTNNSLALICSAVFLGGIGLFVARRRRG